MEEIYILDIEKIKATENKKILKARDSFNQVLKQLLNHEEYVLVGVYYFYHEITIAIILDEKFYNFFNQIHKQYSRFHIGYLLNIFALPKAEIEQYYIEEIKQEF